MFLITQQRLENEKHNKLLVSFNTKLISLFIKFVLKEKESIAINKAYVPALTPL